jgi:hypothetical protein
VSPRLGLRHQTIWTFRFFCSGVQIMDPWHSWKKLLDLKLSNKRQLLQNNLELHLKCKNLKVSVVCQSLMYFFSCFFKRTQHVFSSLPIMIVIVPSATLATPFGAQDCIIIICQCQYKYGINLWVWLYPNMHLFLWQLCRC